MSGAGPPLPTLALLAGGRATRLAVVSCIVLIIVADFIFTMIMTPH